MKNNVYEIKNMVVSESPDDVEEDFAAAQSKLTRILQAASVDADAETKARCAKIEQFMKNETNKRKLLSFCVDFVDPTERGTKLTASGEEIQLVAYLRGSELDKLAQFINKHRDDSTFADTVYAIMRERRMDAPDIYKQAFMRRQDFSRAVSPKSEGVSKQHVWQIIVGLKCSIREADEVLLSAGYVRRRNAFDLTMTYFIENGNYDIMAINDVLHSKDLKVFSCYRDVDTRDPRK